MSNIRQHWTVNYYPKYRALSWTTDNWGQTILPPPTKLGITCLPGAVINHTDPCSARQHGETNTRVFGAHMPHYLAVSISHPFHTRMASWLNQSSSKSVKVCSFMILTMMSSLLFYHSTLSLCMTGKAVYGVFWRTARMCC
jgi:hypothetical protein